MPLKMKLNFLTIILLIFLSIEQLAAQCNFTNPLKSGDAPDPFVMYKEGFYYGCHTTGGDVRIYKSLTLQDIFKGESKSVWGGKPDIWAPEIHYLNGKWYIYTCFNTGNFWFNIIVLEGNSQDALGSYTLKSQFSTLSNGIDATVWQDPDNKQIYMAWSKMDGSAGQEIWMTKMSNPYTLDGSPVRLSYPMYSWEKQVSNVNEGPEFLLHGNKLHIVYSASQCHYENYCLGMLSAAVGSNYMDPSSWSKSAQPVFQKFPGNNAYAVGHHSCLQTPGGEWWLVYHGKYENNRNGFATRDARMQEFYFKDDIPVFGIPVATGEPSACPDSAHGTCDRYLSFANPVIHTESPDPGICYHKGDGYYYLYNTNRRTSRSKDLVNWDVLGNVLDTPGDIGMTWAPEVSKRKKDGLFYMFYTQDTRLYIAKASSPAGPFKHHAGPLLDRWSIDSHFFQDDDGKEYIYWNEGGCGGTSGIWMGELNSDLSAITSPKHCLGDGTHPEGWITECVREAPQMLKHKNKYYLVYSGNGTGNNYGIGYATADSPAGPWTLNPGNPIMWDGKTGPGHCSFTTTPDSSGMLVIYHQWHDGKRCSSVDRAEFVSVNNSADKLEIHYSKKSLQSFPFCPPVYSFIVCSDQRLPFKTLSIPGIIEAEDFDLGCPDDAYFDSDEINNGGQYRITHVDIENTSDEGGGYNVGWISTGERLEYTVDVTQSGLIYVDIRVASASDNNKFQLEFNGINKTGQLTVNNTGGVQSWTNIRKRMYLDAGRYVMKIYVINSSGGFNINKLTFHVPTGIEKKNLNELIDVYPNPAKDQVTLNSNNISVDEITIFDSLGRSVFKNEESFTGMKTISFSLHTGIYLLTLKGDASFSSHKLMVK